jgi:hypothetical protein
MEMAVEAKAHESGGDHAPLDLGGQVEQVHVAGVALVPDAGDPDLGLVHVLFGEPGGVEHRLGGPLGLGLGDALTDLVQFLGHACLHGPRV